MTTHPIIITGFMGSGKTAVARALARILKYEALDLDEVIAQRERRTAKEIIQTDGESAFREIETRTLFQLLKEVRETDVGSVIALGGGTWTLERNRAIIREHNCQTVWLDVTFDLCWKRILASGDKRPLARNESEARELYQVRRDLYRRARMRIAPGENRSVDHVAAEIAQGLQNSELES
jgi:shikimate kinase